MDSTQLYQQILGITAPWQVESVEINHEDQTVTVKLGHERGPDPLKWGDLKLPKSNGKQ